MEINLHKSLSDYQFNIEYDHLDLNDLRSCVNDVFHFPKVVNNENETYLYALIQYDKNCVSLIKDVFSNDNHLVFSDELDNFGWQRGERNIRIFDVSNLVNIKKTVNEIVCFFKENS
tara:strand:+ start:4298 stop:4648 length:351 start_codon:yes stop_codon:yes gene_type:complete